MNKRLVKIDNIELVLEVSSPILPVFTWDNEKPLVLCIFSARTTQYQDIIWLRITTLRPYWPFIKTIGAFTKTDER